MLQGEHSAILSTFIKLPYIFKIFVLSIFEWPFYTGFTVIWKFGKMLQNLLSIAVVVGTLRVNPFYAERSGSVGIVLDWGSKGG